MLPFPARRRSWGVARRKERVTVLWAFWGSRRGGGNEGGPGFLVWMVGWLVGSAVMEAQGRGPNGQMLSSYFALWRAKPPHTPEQWWAGPLWGKSAARGGAFPFGYGPGHRRCGRMKLWSRSWEQTGNSLSCGRKSGGGVTPSARESLPS